MGKFIGRVDDALGHVHYSRCALFFFFLTFLLLSKMELTTSEKKKKKSPKRQDDVFSTHKKRSALLNTARSVKNKKDSFQVNDNPER